MNLFSPIILVFVVVHVGPPAAMASPIQVQVAFVEALDPVDTTSSTRFQKEFEAAIIAGREQSKEDLKECGFELITSQQFYAAGDPLQARETAGKLEAKKPWLIVGPRRSNHYLLLTQGAPNTPSVSLMASSDEVFALSPLHMTLAPSNKELADVAVQSLASTIKKGSNYVSLVAADCLNCKSFATHFDQQALENGVKNVASFSVSGERPDLRNEIATILKLKPNFILLPNYSLLSSYLASEIVKEYPAAFFVGSDGWGTEKFGFVQNNENIRSVRGMAVRGNIPFEKALSTFPLGLKIAKNPNRELVGSASSLGILKVFDGLQRILCSQKPKDAAAFASDFKSKGSKYFLPSWGLGVYRLENAVITFDHAVKQEAAH